MSKAKDFSLKPLSTIHFIDWTDKLTKKDIEKVLKADGILIHGKMHQLKEII